MASWWDPTFKGFSSGRAFQAAARYQGPSATTPSMVRLRDLHSTPGASSRACPGPTGPLRNISAIFRAQLLPAARDCTYTEPPMIRHGWMVGPGSDRDAADLDA